MTQFSWPWQGRAPADGVDAGSYTAAQWWQRAVAMLQIGGMVFPSAGSPIKTETARDNLGVCPNIGNELAVTNPAANDIQIDTGAALADGQPYYNTAAITLTIPAPAANPRIDRIVIRKNYTAVQYDPTGDAGDEEVPAYTARVTRLVGTEAAIPAAPALTQATDRTTYWDVPLAQFQISTGGVVSGLTDEREFAPQWDTENIVDSAITAAKIENETITPAKLLNRTRKFFVPVGFTSVALAASASLPPIYVVPMDSSSLVSVGGKFVVPEDFASSMTISPIYFASGGSGNIYVSSYAYYGAVTESPITHSELSGAAAIAVVATVVHTAVQVLSPANVAAGDIVQIGFSRDATDLLDTYAGTVNFVGFVVAYTADS